MALPIQIPMVDLEYNSDRSLCVRENNSEGHYPINCVNDNAKEKSIVKFKD